MMKQILKIIKKSKNIALFVHVSPDGDCLGSASAFLYALESLGKKVDLFSSDKIGLPYSKMNIFTRVKIAEDIKPENYDLFVSVDCATIKQIGMYGDVFSNFVNTMIIDHHSTNTKYAKTCFVEASSPAAGVVVFDIIKALNVKLTKDIAEMLYIAIMGDTACLMNGNANVKTLQMLATLQETGIDYKSIIKQMFKSKTLEQMRIENIIFQKAIFGEGYAYCKLDYKLVNQYNMNTYDIGSMVRLISDIEGIRVACIVREVSPGEVKGSLRSDGTIDCTTIAVKFGGGGHVPASGFKTSGNIGTISKTLVELLKEETK